MNQAQYEERKQGLKAEICDYFLSQGATRGLLPKILKSLKDDVRNGSELTWSRVAERHHDKLHYFFAALWEIENDWEESLFPVDQDEQDRFDGEAYAQEVEAGYYA